jgi:hypothetical protein
MHFCELSLYILRYDKHLINIALSVFSDFFYKKCVDLLVHREWHSYNLYCSVLLYKRNGDWI